MNKSSVIIDDLLSIEKQNKTKQNKIEWMKRHPLHQLKNK
jgi:hypothetical protein